MVSKKSCAVKYVGSPSVICIVLALASFCCHAQDGYSTSDADRRIFTEAVSALSQYSSLPDDKLLVETARYFIGTPYVAGTLEQIPERLTINLHQTDCILFVEMCLGFVQVLKLPEPTFDDFCDIIKNMRYRNGVVKGYDSRIHYTSEWIMQNEKNDILKEISRDYGKELNQTFSYMSNHPDSYPQLRDSYDMTMRIRRIEESLNSQGPLYYIPSDMLKKAVENKSIHDGDIICFVTPIEGLDISHVAIAYHHNSALHFIHASSKEKKVVIEKKTLLDYTKNGIRVLRPK